jgi:hypothetical protein
MVIMIGAVIASAALAPGAAGRRHQTSPVTPGAERSATLTPCLPSIREAKNPHDS